MQAIEIVILIIRLLQQMRFSTSWGDRLQMLIIGVEENS